MRLIIAALFKVMPSVLNVFGVLLALMTVFAILGLGRSRSLRRPSPLAQGEPG